MKRKILLTLLCTSLMMGCGMKEEPKKAKELVVETAKVEKEEKIVDTKKPTFSTKYVSSQNGLNVRESATEDSKIVTTLSVNSEVQMYDDFLVNGWVKIKYNNNDCYVFEEYLSDEKVEVEIPKEEEKEIEVNNTTAIISNNTETNSIYSASQFMSMGVINWNNWRWTWYSENVLSGGGLNIPNRHVDENGYVCDGEGYICLSSSVLPKGTIIETPFGKSGKIYDSGCASDTIDVYTSF